MPKQHRRTPSSAHTYRLLIVKEHIEQVFVGFRLFPCMQSVLFATAKKRNYAAFSALRQAACFLLFAFAAKTSRNNCTSVATFADLCVRRGEPKIMLHSMSAVK